MSTSTMTRSRRRIAALAGIAAAAALVVGCGGEDTAEPEDPPVVETSEEGADEQADKGDDGTDEEDGTVEPDEGDGTDDGDETDEGNEPDDGDETEADSTPSGDGENIFEGTWGFGHDSKTLSPDELGDLLEDEAESRGPEEMSLEVDCGDGIDTVAGDGDAECVAYADEGVEHLWKVTGNPADAGLEVEVENLG